LFSKFCPALADILKVAATKAITPNNIFMAVRVRQESTPNKPSHWDIQAGSQKEIIKPQFFIPDS